MGTVSLDKPLSTAMLHYFCIEKCQNTTACKGISFDQTNTTCHLKSTTQNQLQDGHSFLAIDCLSLPGHTLYPTYQMEANKHLSCPWYFDDWIPNSTHCYNLKHQPPSSWQDSKSACRLLKGELATVNTVDLNQLLAKKIWDFDFGFGAVWISSDKWVGNCPLLIPDGSWIDGDCSEKYSFSCSVKKRYQPERKQSQLLLMHLLIFFGFIVCMFTDTNVPEINKKYTKAGVSFSVIQLKILLIS